jgi:hypothetical protein
VVSLPVAGFNQLMICAAVKRADEPRCLEVIEYLITHGVPEPRGLSVLPATNAPHLLGKPIEVPAECSLVSAEADSSHGQVVCGSASFSWRVGLAEMTEAQWWGAVDPQGVGERFGCKIAGRLASCARVARGPEHFVLAGYHPDFSVTCTYPGLPTDSPPDLCTRNFELPAR